MEKTSLLPHEITPPQIKSIAPYGDQDFLIFGNLATTQLSILLFESPKIRYSFWEFWIFQVFKQAEEFSYPSVDILFRCSFS